MRLRFLPVLLTTTVVTSLAGGDCAQAQEPLGPDFQVNELDEPGQQLGHVALLPGGGFVVAWDQSDPELGPSIVTRTFSPGGLPTGPDRPAVGPDLVIRGGNAVAAGPDGSRLVAWSDDSRTGFDLAIFASLYNAAGISVREHLRINEWEPDQQAGPFVAADGVSNFIVVWRSDPDAAPDLVGQDGSGSGVFARRISSHGQFLGPELQVNTYTKGDQYPASVAAGPDGRFVVVWMSVGQDGSEGGIYAQRFNTEGEKAGPELRVNQYTESWQELADVAMDAEGGFVVVWESYEQDGWLDGIYARRYDRRGQPRGDEFRVTESHVGWQERPAIAMDSAGNFVVVWLESISYRDSGLYGRAFFADGTPAGGDFDVTSRQFGGGDWPDLALGDTGTLVAVWETVGDFDEIGLDVYGRRFAVPFPSTCLPSERTLCLLGGRFRVEASYAIAFLEDAGQGAGRALPLTADSGAFSFFAEDNLELLVKVVDGCEVNDGFWVFAGGLTNLAVDLTVVDTWTGTLRVYHNPQRTPFVPIQDTAAFATCDALPGGPSAALGTTAGADSVTRSGAVLPGAPSPRSASCSPDATHLCLAGGRFEVSASWRTAAGTTGAGQTLPLTADTGAFWFFAEDNLELLVKVLDACAVNARFWTFAGGLTDVAVTLTVRDTMTGEVQTYDTQAGAPFPPLLDTASFAGCP